MSAVKTGKITSFFAPAQKQSQPAISQSNKNGPGCASQAPVPNPLKRKLPEPITQEGGAPAQNTAPQTADDPPLKKRPSVAISKGHKRASFRSSKNDWDGKYHQIIGKSTRRITFGSEFVLTDDHIDDILALGIRSQVCKELTHFIFEYKDVSYDSHNHARQLTNEAMIRLARACPSLEVIQLQGLRNVSDEVLLALFENCPKLTSIELTLGSGDSELPGKVMDALRENPQWAPGLKNLILSEDDDNYKFMKAMRAATKERQGLTVILENRMEVKKHGDWGQEIMWTKYWNGRKQSK